jgi:Protein of unknown function (DUF3304)
MTKRTCRTWLVGLALALATVLAGCQAIREEKTFGTMMSGIDHLPDHLSVSDFWVNGTGGFQAGKGGRKAPGPVLPLQWHPGLTVHVRWDVSDWQHGGGSKHEADVPVDPYTEEADVWVHFLANGTVRVVVSQYGPRNTNYPGPRDPIPQKYPWKVYPPPTRKGPVFSPDDLRKHNLLPQESSKK